MKQTGIFPQDGFELKTLPMGQRRGHGVSAIFSIISYREWLITS